MRLILEGGGGESEMASQQSLSQSWCGVVGVFFVVVVVVVVVFVVLFFSEEVVKSALA